jgi:recombination protein RecA
VKIVKNKLASPFRDAEVDIYYGHGISKAASILDVATAQGIIQRTGTWFSYGEMKLGQGRDNARDFLETNPELALEIDRRVRVHVGLAKAAPPSAPGRDGAPSREPAKGRA